MATAYSARTLPLKGTESSNSTTFAGASTRERDERKSRHQPSPHGLGLRSERAPAEISSAIFDDSFRYQVPSSSWMAGSLLCPVPAITADRRPRSSGVSLTISYG